MYHQSAKTLFLALIAIPILLLALLGFLSWNVFPFVANAYQTVFLKSEQSCACASQISFLADHPFIGTMLLLIFSVTLLFFFVLAFVGSREAFRLYRFIRAVQKRIRSASPKLRNAAFSTSLLGKVREVEDHMVYVFCHGLLRPKIYISSALIQKVSKRELITILLHEKHHCVSRDPLKLFYIRIIEQTFSYLPGFKHLIQEFKTRMELAADERATRNFQMTNYLGKALLKLLSARHGILPHVPVTFLNVTEERLHQLVAEGRPMMHRIPWRKMLISIFALVVIIFTISYSHELLALTSDESPSSFSRETLICSMPTTQQMSILDTTTCRQRDTSMSCAFYSHENCQIN